MNALTCQQKYMVCYTFLTIWMYVFGKIKNIIFPSFFALNSKLP